MFTPYRSDLALHFCNDSHSVARLSEKAHASFAPASVEGVASSFENTETSDRGAGKNVE